MEINKNTDQMINFDSNPPIELNKYDESIRLFCACYEEIFKMSYSCLKSRLKENADVLIVGAGTGMEICTFGLKSPQWSFTGVDPSNEMLSIAEKKIKIYNLINKIKLINGYTDNIAENNIFDAATCILVMHFLPDENEKLNLLKSISKKLKKDSPFILVDGFGDRNSEEFENIVLAWKKYAISGGVESDIVEDGFKNQILKRINFITEDRIKVLLKNAGFIKISKFFTGFLYGGWLAIKE